MQNNTNYGGISFFGLLQITFIVLKLIDKISWSWWWVLAPTWISVIIAFILLLVLVALIILKAIQ